MKVKSQLLYKPSLLKDSYWSSENWYNANKKITIPQLDDDGIGEFQGNSQDENHWYFQNDGTMLMGGIYPRYYVNKTFKNVEATIYMQRKSIHGKSSDGINIGVRSHEQGHKNVDNGIHYAETHTYYGRLRFNGFFDFAKEAHHRGPPYDYDSTYRTWGNGEYRKSKKVFSGGEMPRDQWIGWKFICANIKNSKGKKILLQTWIDLKSNGDPEKFKKENWELVESFVDEYGKFPTAPSKAYEIFGTDPKSIFDASGVVILRTGFSSCLYKDFYIHEIEEIYEPCIKINPSFRYSGSSFEDYASNIKNIVVYVVEGIFSIFK